MNKFGVVSAVALGALIGFSGPRIWSYVTSSPKSLSDVTLPDYVQEQDDSRSKDNNRCSRIHKVDEEWLRDSAKIRLEQYFHPRDVDCNGLLDIGEFKPLVWHPDPEQEAYDLNSTFNRYRGGDEFIDKDEFIDFWFSEGHQRN